jgi:hypothetical protein
MDGRVSGFALLQPQRRKFASRFADTQKQNATSPTSAAKVTEPSVIPTTVPADSAAVEGDGDGVLLGVLVADAVREVEGVMLNEGVTEMVGLVDEDFVANRRARGCSRRRIEAARLHGIVAITVDDVISVASSEQAHWTPDSDGEHLH